MTHPKGGVLQSRALWGTRVRTASRPPMLVGRAELLAVRSTLKPEALELRDRNRDRGSDGFPMACVPRAPCDLPVGAVSARTAFPIDGKRHMKALSSGWALLS